MVAVTKDSQLSLRVPSELKERMETYAQLTGRSKSHVVMEALGDYLAWRTPQIEDLRSAIQEADRGEFASEGEVAAVFAKYTPQSGKPARKRSTAKPARK